MCSSDLIFCWCNIKIATGEDWYVLQAVYRMLEGKLFRKHNVSATRWVYQQLRMFDDENVLPSIVPKIIHELVQKFVVYFFFLVKKKQLFLTLFQVLWFMFLLPSKWNSYHAMKS